LPRAHQAREEACWHWARRRHGMAFYHEGRHVRRRCERGDTSQSQAPLATAPRLKEGRKLPAKPCMLKGTDTERWAAGVAGSSLLGARRRLLQQMPRCRRQYQRFSRPSALWRLPGGAFAGVQRRKECCGVAMRQACARVKAKRNGYAGNISRALHLPGHTQTPRRNMMSDVMPSRLIERPLYYITYAVHGELKQRAKQDDGDLRGLQDGRWVRHMSWLPF